ncbi:MAG: hypothetical protein ABEI52_09120 [Halobacteriaceae archaeon]
MDSRSIARDTRKDVDSETTRKYIDMDLRTLILSSVKKLGFLRSIACFDYFGVSRHAPKNVDLADPSSWDDIVEQARWADAVCVAHASDRDFNEHMLGSSDVEMNFPQLMNTTSVGNAAYMATSIHVPPEYRARWARVYEGIRGSYGFEKRHHPPLRIDGDIDYFALTWTTGWLHPVWVTAYLIHDFIFYASIFAGVLGVIFAVNALTDRCLSWLLGVFV